MSINFNELIISIVNETKKLFINQAEKHYSRDLAQLKKIIALKSELNQLDPESKNYAYFSGQLQKYEMYCQTGIYPEFEDTYDTLAQIEPQLKKSEIKSLYPFLNISKDKELKPFYHPTLFLMAIISLSVVLFPLFFLHLKHAANPHTLNVIKLICIGFFLTFITMWFKLYTKVYNSFAGYEKLLQAKAIEKGLGRNSLALIAFSTSLIPMGILYFNVFEKLL